MRRRVERNGQGDGDPGNRDAEEADNRPQEEVRKCLGRGHVKRF